MENIYAHSSSRELFEKTVFQADDSYSAYCYANEVHARIVAHHPMAKICLKQKSIFSVTDIFSLTLQTQLYCQSCAAGVLTL